MQNPIIAALDVPTAEQAQQLARDLAPASLAHERAEVIEVHWLPLDEACTWALDGTITDCKTALGLLRGRAVVRCAA